MKKSAGILAYRYKQMVEVLLVHPGGPFYTKKDLGVWSIPKGEYVEEEPFTVAKREFFEETGNIPDIEKAVKLEDTRLKSGKQISVWAVECDFEQAFIKSNMFEIEWPPKSGKIQSFPEADKAEWFALSIAKEKIHPGQLDFINQLEKLLNANL